MIDNQKAGLKRSTTPLRVCLVAGALLLCLGEHARERVARFEGPELLTQLESLYREHPDAGVHSATEWLLRRWGRAAYLASECC